VENLYREILGPLSSIQFEKIREGLNAKIVMQQINEFIDLDLITDSKAQEMKSRVTDIFGERVVDIPAEVKRAYALMLGPLGIKKYQNIEKDLNKNSIIKQIEELQEIGVLNEEKALEFKDKINNILGE